MRKSVQIRKVNNGYIVVLTEITGITATSTETQYVFSNWNAVMICVSEFMGEYEGD